MKTLFRTVEIKDLEDIYQLSLNAGYGLTTLPKNKEALRQRIQRSINSFSKNVIEPFNENYFFVLEDLVTNNIVGTSSIEAYVGNALPFYAYRISKVSNISHTLNLTVNYQVLILNNDLQGASEICSLYLSPAYRVNNNGLVLSRARFLFMSFMPERFSDQIIAEMRGVSDKKGNSPFWESFGKHFFKMPFSKADELSVLTNKQFISDLLPQHPIHVNLLTKAAQASIGQPHKSTVPAMKILQKEGFNYADYVDIFDAGPAIQAKKNAISTIKNRSLLCVSALIEKIEGEFFLISNCKLNFKALRSNAIFTGGEITLTHSDALLLDVKIGDQVQVINLI